MADKEKANGPGHSKGKPQQLEELPPEIEERVLRFVNAARMPADLLRPPQRFRLTAGEHEHHTEHAGHERPAAPPSPEKIPEGLARDLIRKRPPRGYIDLRQLIEIHRERWRRWLEQILWLFRASQYGSWSAPEPLEVGGTTYQIMHAALLKTGKVLLVPSSTNTLLWDPAGPTLSLLTGATTGLTVNLFCSGHSFLSDGQLLVVGGGGGGPGVASSNQAWRFDPLTEQWTRAGDMAYQRWYPTVVTLGDEPGRALVISGWLDSTQDTAPHMEVYSEVTDSFTPVTVTGPVGEKVGPQTYPGMHLLPGGEIFYAPVGFGDCSQLPAPYSGTEPSGYFELSGTSGSWTDTGANIRTKGMSVLLLQPTYPFVRVLVVGGGTAVENGTGQLINLSTLTPSWGPTFALLEPRVHPNVVLLPDGNVFICGGMEATGTPANGGPCEMYDPEAGTLVEMAAVAHARHYHSVALLLPSAQVMVAGGAVSGGCSLSGSDSIEVYSPPYLFAGPRPTMGPLPPLVHHGNSFLVDTPDANAIAKVVLVRPMAVTHQTDTEQRVVNLPFVQTSPTQLNVTMPDGMHPHGMAPRGHYLLFILTASGVPSIGQFVFLH